MLACQGSLIIDRMEEKKEQSFLNLKILHTRSIINKTIILSLSIFFFEYCENCNSFFFLICRTFLHFRTFPLMCICLGIVLLRHQKKYEIFMHINNINSVLVFST